MVKRLGTSRYTPEQTKAIVEQEIRAYAKANGLSETFVRHALAIPAHESGGFIDDALNDGSAFGTVEYSVGPWQLNLNAHKVTAEQAQDPVFSTRFWINNVAKAYQALGGDQSAQADPIGFQTKFHPKAQVSIALPPERAREALALASTPSAPGRLQNLPGSLNEDHALENLPGRIGGPTPDELVPLGPAKSPYAFPVQGYQGNVDLHWGEHQGAADIFAAPGTPVQAMAGGTVISVGNSGPGGNNVTVQGEDGNVYYYAHLIDVPKVQAGQQIQAGTVLGGVGDTGNAKGTGAHLHVGIGPSISRGVGPAGGAGENFDAVGLLRNTLAGTAAAPNGGPAMVTGAAGASGSFFTSQIEDAKRQVAWAQQRQAEIRAGKSGQDARADQLELEHLDTRIADEMVRLDAMQTALANERDLNPTPEGRDPVATAGAIAGVRGAADEHNRWLFDTFVGLLDKNFANQLGVSGLLRDIFNINEQNAQAKVDSEIARGTLLQSGREAAIQAYAMQQTAEAARAGEVLARAGKINEADWMIAERRLPPGTHHVPGLEPDGDLMTAVRNIGLPGKGLKVVPTDWNKLDFRTSLADAETTVPAVPQFPIGALESQVAENAKIQPYQPRTLTPESAGVPVPPNLTDPSVTAMIPKPSQAGGMTDEDLIDIILGRGKYASPATTQTAAIGPPAAATQAPASTPVTRATGQPNPQAGPEGAGSTARLDLPVSTAPVTAPSEEEEDPWLALLKKFGISVPALSSPAATGAAAIQGAFRFIR